MTVMSRVQYHPLFSPDSHIARIEIVQHDEPIIDKRYCSPLHQSLFVHLPYALHIFFLAVYIDTGHRAQTGYRAPMLEMIPYIYIRGSAHICLVCERMPHLMWIDVVIFALKFDIIAVNESRSHNNIILCCLPIEPDVKCVGSYPSYTSIRRISEKQAIAHTAFCQLLTPMYT